MSKTAILFGATGLIGSHLLYKLVDCVDYTEVTVVTRKKLDYNHPKIKNVVSNMDDLEKIFTHPFDAVFVCLGTTIKKAGSQKAFKEVDFDLIVKIATFANNNQCKQLLLVSALGANASSSIFYNKIKGQTEDAIKAMHLKSLIIFQPSLLLGKRQEFRLGEKVAILAAPLINLFLQGSLAKYQPIQAEKVADSMLWHSLQPHDANKKIKVLEGQQILIK